MAIPITYLPATLARTGTDVSEEERESLRAARANAFEPLDFDLDGAFVALSDKGYSSRDSLDLIARKLSQKADFDLESAKEAGFTTEQVVAKLIGRDPDDLRSAPVGTFFGGIARGAVEGAPAGAAGLAAYLGLGAFTTASAPILFGAGLTAMLAIGLTGVGEKLEEKVFGKRQRLPGERGPGVAGEVLGSVVSAAPFTQVALRAIPEAVDLGSKKLLKQHLDEKNKILDKTGELFVKEGGIPNKIRRRQFLEKVIARVGEEARGKTLASGTVGQKAVQEAKNFANFGLKEVAASAIPAAAEGFAEAFYPGDDSTRTIAGIAASFIPSPALVAADAATTVGGRVVEDVREKGFTGSAKNLFGLRDRGDRLRRQKAAEMIVRAYETAQRRADEAAGRPVRENTALAFADELDRLVADDPEFAALLTPGQITNDPFILLMEAATRRGNEQLTREQKDFGIQSRQHLRQLIETMRIAGGDELLREAGRLEQEGLETGITQLLDDKLAAAAEAADRLQISRGDTETIDAIRTKQGILLRNAAEEAIKESKKLRGQLYDAVDKTVTVSTAPILESYRQLRAENLLTEAGELKGDLINDLRNYGLDTDTGLQEILNQASSRKKALNSRQNTVGASFQRLAENNPEAFNRFDLLVDTASGPSKRGYERRLDRVIDGFSRKIDDEGAEGVKLPQGVRNNILKMARQAKEIESIKRNLANVEAEIKDINLGDFVTDEPKMMPIGELLAFRSKVREQLRDADRGIKDGPTVPQLTILNRGVTDAIQQRIDSGTVDGVVSDNLKALDLAERYAKAHQEVFRRTFIGQLGREKPVGADLIAPEQALNQLFTGRPIQNVQETLAAFNFRGLDGAPIDLGDAKRATASGALDAFLRTELLGKAKTVTVQNPLRPNETPMTALTLSDRDVQQFLDQRSEVIRALDPDGELIGDLRNAATAKIALESALAQGSERAKTHLKEVNLSKFLGASSAETVIQRVLSGDTPDADLKSLARRINTAQVNDVQKEEFKEALFSTVIGAALKRSLKTVNGQKVIDFNTMSDILFDTANRRLDVGLDKFPREGPSLIQILEQNGGVPKEQAEELKAFLNRGKKLEDALASGAEDFLNAKENQAVKDFIARYAGAQGIAELTRAVGMSPTIQTTGAGAQALRHQFINLPNIIAKDILIDASRPGEKGAKTLADMMRAGATPQEQNGILVRIAKNILASPTYLNSVTVRGAEAGIQDLLGMQPTLDPAPAEEPVAMDAPLPPPVLPPTAQQMSAPQPAPPPQGAPNPQQRQQFAALFPNDPISGLIQQQGIGSLPQAPG